MKFIMLLTILLQSLHLNCAGGKLFTLKNNCGFKISVTSNNLTFKKGDSKNVYITIQNVSNDTLLIPDNLLVGEKNDINAEIIFEVEKWSNNEKKYSHIDSDIAFDYTYYTSERIYTSLASGQVKILKKDIGFCNDIDKPGKYRFMLILRKLCPKHEIKLDWVEFEVI